MNPMPKSTPQPAPLRTIHSTPDRPGATSPTPSPVVRHIHDGVIRRTVRGDHAAIDTLARSFRPEMLAHAEAHLARFDMDAEEVVQNVFVALLERKLPDPPRAKSAVEWLLDTVALFAQPDLTA